MGQISEQGKHELIVALKHRNWLFAEMEERVAMRGWKSRCMFSGEIGHCAIPDHSHHCLAGIRRQYASSVKRVRALQLLFPEILKGSESISLEKTYRLAKRRKSKSVGAAS